MIARRKNTIQLCCPGNKCRPGYLSAGLTWDDLANAMTDPNKRFEFPIKPMTYQIDLTPGAKVVVISAAAMLTLGMIAIATRNK